MLRKKIAALMGVGLLAATAALAAPLHDGYVAADADWVCHVDLERVPATAVGAELVEHGFNELLKHIEDGHVPHYEKVLDAVELVANVKSVTAFGTAGKHPGGVVLVQTEGRLTDLLAKVDPRVEVSGANYHDHDVFVLSTPEFKGRMLVCEHRTGIIVASVSQDRLEQALSVLDGAQQSAAEAGTFAELALADDAIATVMARKIDLPLKQGSGTAALADQVGSVAFALGENGPDLQATLKLQAKSDAAALQIKQMVDGVVAMAMLSAAEKPRLARLVEGLSTSLDGNVVSIDARHASKEILTSLRQVREAVRAAAAPPAM